MIALRRLNNEPIMVNPDLIESLEATPDTVVTLTSGNKLLVRDSMDEVREKIIEFKRRIHGPEGAPRSRLVALPNGLPSCGRLSRAWLPTPIVS